MEVRVEGVETFNHKAGCLFAQETPREDASLDGGPCLVGFRQILKLVLQARKAVSRGGDPRRVFFLLALALCCCLLDVFGLGDLRGLEFCLELCN